jgi:ketosteroid isomerase-like protein
MTPQDNVATMRRAYDAFNTGDLDTLSQLMDEGMSWHLPGRSPMADDYESRDATLAYFGELAQKTDGTFRAELESLAADGENHVVGIHRSTADRNGKHLDVHDCIVFEVSDGRITDGREHFEDLYAWDEFWAG